MILAIIEMWDEIGVNYSIILQYYADGINYNTIFIDFISIDAGPVFQLSIWFRRARCFPPRRMIGVAIESGYHISRDEVALFKYIRGVYARAFFTNTPIIRE